MGVSELVSTERPLELRDNIWVFRELGDPQPEQATVMEVERADSGDHREDMVFVEFWDSKTKNEYVPAVGLLQNEERVCSYRRRRWR